jgi:hypothetical protein
VEWQVVSIPNWTTKAILCEDNDFGCMTGEVTRIGFEASQIGEVLPLVRPATNSSYNLQFEGPSVSCRPPNGPQQEAFTYYANRSAIEHYVMTNAQISNGWFNFTSSDDIQIFPRFWSAFSLSDSDPGVIADRSNWLPELTSDPDSIDDVHSAHTSELWIQLFDQNIICTAVNAEFDITVQYEGGSQSILTNRIKATDQFLFNDDRSQGTMNDSYVQNTTYLNIFRVFAGILNGNISYDVSRNVKEEETSFVLTTSLGSCPELNLYSFLSNATSELLLSPWNSNGAQSLGRPNYFTNTKSETTCRNGSLGRALEDLANNITISMLSSSILT